MEPPSLEKSSPRGLDRLIRWADFILLGLVLLYKITDYTSGFMYDRLLNILIGFALVACSLLMLCGAVCAIFAACFHKVSFKQLGIIWVSLVTAIGIAWLPAPGITDGLKHRLRWSHTEAELLQFAANARKADASLREEKNYVSASALRKKLSATHPSLTSVGITMSPVIVVRPDCVELLWGSWAAKTWGIRIEDQGDGKFSMSSGSEIIPEYQQVYPRVYVYFLGI